MSTRLLVRKHVAVLALGVCALGMVNAGSVSAQSVGPSVAPSNINAAQPTISGTLVAKPVNGQGTSPPRAGIIMLGRQSGHRSKSRTRGLYRRRPSGPLANHPLNRLLRPLLGPLRAGAAHRWRPHQRLGRTGSGGFVLNPTYAVQDTDIQEAFVDSQDFIAASGPRLMLFVLKSDANGPVKGMVHAVRGGVTHITLCNGQPGTWADLTAGKTIDITRSLFNRRLDTYIHTGNVRVVSCP